MASRKLQQQRQHQGGRLPVAALLLALVSALLVATVAPSAALPRKPLADFLSRAATHHRHHHHHHAPATTSPSIARFMSSRPLTRMSWPTDSDPTQPSNELKRLTLQAGRAGCRGRRWDALLAWAWRCVKAGGAAPAAWLDVGNAACPLPCALCADPPEGALMVPPRLDPSADLAHGPVLLVHPLPLGTRALAAAAACTRHRHGHRHGRAEPWLLPPCILLHTPCSAAPPALPPQPAQRTCSGAAGAALGRLRLLARLHSRGHEVLKLGLLRSALPRVGR